MFGYERMVLQIFAVLVIGVAVPESSVVRMTTILSFTLSADGSYGDGESATGLSEVGRVPTVSVGS